MIPQLSFILNPKTGLLASYLTDRDLMNVAQTCKEAYAHVTNNDRDWRRRALKENIPIDPNSPLSVFQQYVHPHLPEVQAANAYNRASNAVTRFFQSEVFQNPAIPSSLEDERAPMIPVTAKQAGMFWTAVGAGCAYFACSEEIAGKDFWTSLMVNYIGKPIAACSSVLWFPLGISYLIKDSPIPAKAAGHLMALQTKARIAGRRCLNSYGKWLDQHRGMICCLKKKRG